VSKLDVFEVCHRSRLCNEILTMIRVEDLSIRSRTEVIETVIGSITSGRLRQRGVNTDPVQS
jgi:hypothetical protein